MCYGGFDGTSNVLAGKLFNIPVKGTHAHAYITSFTGIDELKTRVLQHKEDGTTRDLLELAIEHRAQLTSVLDVSTDESSEGELAAMVSFAIAFPDGFMALVDTYDVKSDKLLGEPTVDLLDAPDTIVCDPFCVGRMHGGSSEELLQPFIVTTLSEIPEEECNGCATEECGQPAEAEIEQLTEDAAVESEPAPEEPVSRSLDETEGLPGPEVAAEESPPSAEGADGEDQIPTTLIVVEDVNSPKNDENGNDEDMEDQNILITVSNGDEADDEADEGKLDEIEQHEQAEEAEEITRCANCEALNTMIHHLKSVGKSFRSGLLNFCAVALALNEQGFRAIGIRIDSGDLAYLSCLARETFERIAERFKLPWFSKLTIVASNDINEETILSLNEQGHKIDCFGIGTHLVTCQRQPALGCVYKMVEINGQPRIKLSQDVGKVTMPGNKNVFRLYGADGHALIDLLQRVDENPPEMGQKVLCRHPFQESKRAYVIPTQVEPLYRVYWTEGKVAQVLPSLEEVRERVQVSLKTLRQDHKRTLNPTPYKVAVSDNLYNFIHELWLQNAPIGELS
ncbi:hypothetical protein AND_004264 [Anopheles darlingi]|uniref:nicotinate phosphoribosyltransferase n=1 Tax=Anopheles darlingi TaxID=43151 RepID=W5JL27_ANODA|nr:hypothetical protein AND_004264 [Anopheles darlingi]